MERSVLFTAQEKSSGAKNKKCFEKICRASSIPLSVVTEMASFQFGRSVSNLSTSVLSTCTSPTLTACSHATSWAGCGKWASPNNFSVQPRRYRPCFQHRHRIQGLTIARNSKYNPFNKIDIKESRPCFPFASVVLSAAHAAHLGIYLSHQWMGSRDGLWRRRLPRNTDF